MLTVQENIPLASLTTFQIGGNARYFVEVSSEDGIREALDWARKEGVSFVILAGGSNVLVSDDGFDGLVISMRFKNLTFKSGVLDVGAGCNLLDIIRTSAERGLGGWEKLAGIPGTVGGAVRGNAGAFGSEMKDFVVSIRTLNTNNQQHHYTTNKNSEVTPPSLKVWSNTECDFSYRHSFFKDHPEWIILGAQIRLVPTDAGESKRLIDETIAERELRHLQDVKAAGSYFMNPIASQEIVAMFEREKRVRARAGRVPAGWLIEKAGMKGVTVGGAQASEQHPNYLINTGTATAVDVLALAEKIKEAVEKQFGVRLQEEAVRV